MDLKVADAAIEAFDDYYRIQDRILNGSCNDLGTEVRKRLAQAKKLIQLVKALHDHEGPALQQKLAPPKPADAGLSFEQHLKSPEYIKWKSHLDSPEWAGAARRLGEVGEELELYTESFYWVTGRARTELQNMPGLVEFEAEGVRNVSSMLMERPDPEDGISVMGTFGWGTPAGPVVNVARWSARRPIFDDAGLYPNAEEFFNSVRDLAVRVSQAPELIRL